MTEEKLREILMVRYSRHKSYFNYSGTKSFNDFVDFLKKPPEDIEEDIKYHGKNTDRCYDCYIYASPEYLPEDSVFYNNFKSYETLPFSASCDINLVRHYKKNTLYIHLQPIFDELPDTFLFPIIKILNKEFELGECTVIEQCVYDKEEQENKK